MNFKKALVDWPGANLLYNILSKGTCIPQTPHKQAKFTTLLVILALPELNVPTCRDCSSPGIAENQISLCVLLGSSSFGKKPISLELPWQLCFHAVK